MNNINKDNFIYCPRCSNKSLNELSEKSFTCSNCGFLFFLNVAASAAAIILDKQSRMLITIRNNDPGKGKWDLPGGFVDPNETIEECLEREVYEELNIKLSSVKYYCSRPNTYEYNGISYSTIDLAFVCEVDDFSNIEARDDVKSFFFCPLKEIKLANFGFNSIKEIVSLYLRK